MKPKGILIPLLVLTVILFGSYQTAYGNSISGSVTIGSLGEAGNYIDFTFSADFPTRMSSAVLDFTGKDVELGTDTIFLSNPNPNPVIGAWTTNTSPATQGLQVFNFSFGDFNSGESWRYYLDLDKPSFSHSGTPLGDDYVGGWLQVSFTDLPGPLFGDLTPEFFKVDALTGRVNFSYEVIPIPATLFLFGSGLMGLGALRSRIRKK